MLFNSAEFLIFFPLVCILFFLIPFRFQWVVLLAASYYFYMSWKPEYVVLIIFTTLVDYFVAIRMARTPPGNTRKLYLLASIVVHLSVLFSFKYFTFFGDTVKFIIGAYQPGELFVASKLLIPVGISFYTFKSLSYTIDVYRGKFSPERHFGIFAVYVSFFPHLVAGPIDRADHLIPQLHRPQSIDPSRFTEGLLLIGWGFFKKLVVADRLALIVSTVYNDPTQYTGMPLIIATVMFSIQIYCDFSGYTDIALGVARLLGYELVDNFKQPYLSLSIAEFWRRWHISLSTWFRDYVYIPLGGSRVSNARQYFNVMVVFLLSGLWHGANWTFVIWGGLHGLFLVVSLYIKNHVTVLTPQVWLSKFPRLRTSLLVVSTFSLVTFAWIFFRADTLADALYIATHLFRGIELRGGYGLNLGGLYEIVIILVSIAVVLAVDVLQYRGRTIQEIFKRPVWMRWSLYYLLIFSILLFGKLGTTEFIYYQF